MNLESLASVNCRDARTYMASLSPWPCTSCLIAADLIALSVDYWLCVVGRYLIKPSYDLGLYFEIFPVVTLFALVFSLQGLYPGLLLHPAEEIKRIFNSFGLVALIVAASAFLWKTGPLFSRSILLAVWAIGIPLVLGARYLVRAIAERRQWWGVPAVVIGPADACEALIRRFSSRRVSLRLTGVLTNDDPLHWHDDLPPILGDIRSAPLIAKSGFANYAILALHQAHESEFRYFLEDSCGGFRHVLLAAALPGICSVVVAPRDLNGDVGFELSQRLAQTRSSAAKRTTDILFSAVALFLLSPLFLIVFVAIKVREGGSVFFGHARYGRDGKPFYALKFRTMAPNAHEILDQHLRDHPELLAEWKRDHKLKQDPRVTTLGHWLRRFSLDELPQLWNVLTGDMSLVGPRPIVQAEINKYGRGFNLYQRVRPGITGLWQVSGRNNTSYSERVALDEYYVRNWSVWLDYYILLRTIAVVLSAKGAY